MKKFFVLCMSLMMAITLVACGKAEEGKAYTSSVEVLETMLNKEELDFPFMGGGFENAKDNAPAKVDSKDEAFINAFGIKGEMTKKVKEMASMTHLMNQNTFNCVAVMLNDGEDAKAFAKEMETNLANTQWLCGAPSILYVIDCGNNTLVCMYGDGEVTDPVKEKAMKNLTGSTLLTETSLAE